MAQNNPEEKLEKAKQIASRSQNRGQYETVEENLLKFFRWVSTLIDRLFFSTMRADGYAALHHKPCASIVVARRAGTSASFDVLNKYATISQMIVVGSSYWNEFHALTKNDVPGDPEGLQTLRNLARNMVYVMKCQKAGRDAGILPPANESGVFTNFVR